MSRTILVTGSSKGIGRAIAHRIARDGFTVVVHYHDDGEGAAETLSLISKNNGSGRVIRFDLADRQECRVRIESDIDRAWRLLWRGSQRGHRARQRVPGAGGRGLGRRARHRPRWFLQRVAPHRYADGFCAPWRSHRVDFVCLRNCGKSRTGELQRCQRLGSSARPRHLRSNSRSEISPSIASHPVLSKRRCWKGCRLTRFSRRSRCAAWAGPTKWPPQ